MTEENTRNRLRRPSFTEMREMVRELARTSISFRRIDSTDYAEDRTALLEKHYWQESEYNAIVLEQYDDRG